jgi:hypothetical protein
VELLDLVGEAEGGEHLAAIAHGERPLEAPADLVAEPA